MNTKITNYVEVLFKDIPNTKKAQELKEELLSTLNDHFEEHIAEGKSENQAYTEALTDIGDIDALLKELEPEKELQSKIQEYRNKRAKFTSIAIMLYILSVVSVIATAGITEILNHEKKDLYEIVGIIIMFVFIAIATGLIIYVNMSKPQDVEQYLTSNKKKSFVNYNGNSKTLRTIAAFMKLYWMIVLIVYLAVSFTTGQWAWTWIIWLIGSAIKQAIYIFFNTNDEEVNSYNR